MAMLLEYRNDKIDARLVFDDDGKTAYAYLFVGEDDVGDVWLYNVIAPPWNPEWSDKGKMPFLNPTDFALQESFEPISDPSEIELDWEGGSSELHQVTVLLRGQKHAVLRPGAKPGWCRLAAKAGPLARPLSEVK